MLTRCTFLLLCLWASIVLQAQDGYKTIAKPSKKQIDDFWGNYNALPDTLNMEQYETVAEQILYKKDSHIEITPATFKEFTEQVLLKEAYTGYREPVYKAQEEKILVCDAHKLITYSPALYDVVEDSILVQRSNLVWVKNKKFKGKLRANCYDSKTNMDTCLWKPHNMPPRYAPIRKSVLKKRDSLEIAQVEAQYIIVNKMIIDKVATAKNALQSKTINIPAEYQSINKKVLVSDATFREIEMPAEYTTIHSKKLVKAGLYYPPDAMSPFLVSNQPPQVAAVAPKSAPAPTVATAYLTYQAPPPIYPGKHYPQQQTKSGPVYPAEPSYSHDMQGDIRPHQMVEAKVTTSKIAQIQQALKEKGYDPGPIDNVLGAKTRQALIQFQKDNNVPVGNLNIETMRYLLDEDGAPSPKSAPTPDYFSQAKSFTDLEQGYQKLQNQLKDSTITQAQFRRANNIYLEKKESLSAQLDKPLLFAYGKDSITNFVKKHLNYPKEAQQHGIEGTVLLEFTVDSSGKAVKPVILKGVSWDVNQEALQLVEQMPSWQPKTKYGINVESKEKLALEFTLDDKGKYPTVGVANSFKPIIENEFLPTAQNPLSTFSIDVDNASYSITRYSIEQGQLPYPESVRTEEFINYFKYDYPQPTDQRPFSISTEMQRCPWNDKHHLLLVGLQGREIEMTNLPPSNLVFLIDVSGSMSDELPLVVESLSLLVEKMRQQDRIAIVVYAGASGLILPPTLGNEKEKILATLNNLRAGGSTAGGAGIQLAYKTARENFLPNSNNRIILITDGDFNVGITSENDLLALIEKERESGVFLSCLGIGSGNYQDARMEMLADKGNGNYSYIDNLREAKKALVEQMSGTLLTIAKDVKIQIDFNPTNIKGYRLVGYENRVMDAEDFDNDKKDAGELGAGHSVTALYEIILHSNNTTPLTGDTLKNKPTKGRYNKASGDLLTVKLRYKLPTDSTSLLIEQPLGRLALRKEMSDNFKWAASVAAYALCLRNSQFKGSATFANILKNAQNAMSFDPNDYRKGFISLLEKTIAIAK